MSRVFFAIAMAALVAAPVSAQRNREDSVQFPNGRSDWRASDVVAKERFWDFATCVADRQPDKSLALIGDAGRGQDITVQLRRLARDNAVCMGRNSDVMSLDGASLINALAGILYGRLYNAETQPDYSITPPVFTAEAISRGSDDQARKRLVMAAFGECVVRSNPPAVFALLRTAHSSPDTRPAWDALNETMGYCLPAEEGASIVLDPHVLRLSISQAIVALEGARSTGPSGQKRVAQ